MVSNKVDPMLNQHEALNATYKRLRQMQSEVEDSIVTRPAVPLDMSDDPDKIFDTSGGLPKEERQREFHKTLHDPLLRRARLDQTVSKYPKMPKHMIPREIVEYYLAGIKEFGLFA